ncbi:MAG: MFS transporter [Gammaproteobacteria bacterium]|nr:MFS transporter [Gammaproteobacteria bacterium]MBU1600603.1 MFS transporter [Gammaproteobacteria bacterium]MBU2435059.1 MFS transporter [Gammaproteobacteria bacterium]MBU2448295.1 MFS transporter [Gammaproteobacteria bacterium]
MAGLGLRAAIVSRSPALGQRNFRRYFYGQICSVLGTFIQAVALSWLVYRMTGSPALLGLTAFLSQAPQLVVSPLAGVLIDRFDRRRILIVLQSIFAVQALLLAGLVAFELIEVWHILALAFLLGVLHSFDLPSRHSLLLYLVDDRSTLANAVALNAAVVHSGRLIGPPVAGLLLAVVPESVCFLINALSYFGPIVAITFIRADIPRQEHLTTALALREVASFIRRNFEAKVALGAVALVNATASTYVVLMPVFAKDVFAGGAQSLGILLGMGGAGALMASIYLSTRARSEIAIGFQVWSCVLSGVGMIGLGLAGQFDYFWLALPMVALIGAGIGATNIAGNTRLQYQVPDTLRGRIISIFGSLRFGFDALGGLIAGALAAIIGVLPVTFGLGLLLVAGSLLLMRRLRNTPS